MYCLGMAEEESSAAPHRRHHYFVAAAGAAVDFLAGAELHVLAQADPDFAEAPAGAGHRNRRAAQARVDLDEGRLEIIRSDGFLLRQLQEFLGYLHRCARLADALEIGPRAKARTGAVLVPLVEDQAGRRHQVQHRGHDVAVEPWRGPLAVFGKAALILRPQAVNHEGIGPFALDL